ncbi:MAG TPA: hypothetical protein VGQ59_16905 [Cyclobacteriaceae bacterium]|jgi:hypothetical protein|nr:hypothetical protein [Cyclobacteriaceae bacterium]
MFIPFEKLPPHSRIWIYQSDRPFSIDEEKIISDSVLSFCSQWEAHGNPLQTSFKIEHHQFIILVVDESSAGASGCSIDGSVRVLKELGSRLNIDFFDRSRVAFLENEKVQTYSLSQLKSLFQSGELTSASQTFNNLVASKAELEINWKTSAQKSWLTKYLPKDTLSV